ncbi:MAG TPA: cytidine deaminase [Spirochaetota bacterium]|jgi:cytidine deaminase|nr:MAG: Cytidine deaminase [Spirochaetes bacterium ADurb.Bin133]HNZ25643.1 cytidine deaminase [Spirochaetota bacterium]HOF01432.1 cytidine deaminase [Spirochaetota bacterium]HOS33006.1 cytidine deaminase [Spirochaetota bacterium]HOS55377.1 cytidine deaminase [Spirochaetota bacterium]
MKEKDIINLITTASQAALNSYSPYSLFRVGAALLAKDGRIFTGTNVENRSFGGTICAERTAIVKAVSEGVKDYSALAVIGLDSAEILPPCGICRQFISEFGSDVTIIMANKSMEYEILSIGALYPYDSLRDLNSNKEEP